MTTAAPKKPATRAAAKTAPKAGEYLNGSRENIFTSKGRCAPGQRVKLDEEEAKTYKGLELCL